MMIYPLSCSIAIAIAAVMITNVRRLLLRLVVLQLAADPAGDEVHCRRHWYCCCCERRTTRLSSLDLQVEQRYEYHRWQRLLEVLMFEVEVDDVGEDAFVLAMMTTTVVVVFVQRPFCTINCQQPSSALQGSGS